MKQGDISRYKDLGPLHDLLLSACPPGENGTRSIVVLAGYIQVSHQYVYRWIKDNRVPARFVRRLVELSGGKLELADFNKYVF